MGKIREYSDTALIFYLKAAWPEKYARLEGDSVAVNVSQNAPSPALVAAMQRSNEIHERLTKQIEEQFARRMKENRPHAE